jgi:SPASM domain peptide maturase of grasp-with-spasm system
MTFISLLPSTIITVGANRSCLIDVEKSFYCLIPNSLANLFYKSKTFCKEDIISNLDAEGVEILDEYIDFLIKNNLIIESHSNKMNFVYYENEKINIPFAIQSAIIDGFNESDLIPKINFFNDVAQYLQLRVYDAINLTSLSNILDYMRSNGIINVELVVKYDGGFDVNDMIELFNNFKIISRIILYNFSENKLLFKKSIIGLQINIFDSKSCGIISEKLFMPNIQTITLSQKHNSCLHKKISIDKDGNIKNCPSMPQSFGNIKDTTLEEALTHPDFKKYWNVNKDMIAVCKDCEFRHICTDCRAYTERNHFDGELDLSKPLKCGYNPYTNEWAEWSTNPLKEKAIDYYGMQDLVKKDA